MKDNLILQGVSLILRGLEVDMKDRNFVKTPWRVLETYKELFGKSVGFPPVFEEKYNDMICMKGHEAWALCPHHLLPVRLTISLAYVPSGAVVGLSKMARVADSILCRPMMQEEATHEIVDAMMTKIDPSPLGVGCVIEGEHLCMIMRGVKSSGRVTTSAMRGVFFDVPETRAEFMALVRNGQ